MTCSDEIAIASRIPLYPLNEKASASQAVKHAVAPKSTLPTYEIAPTSRRNLTYLEVLVLTGDIGLSDLNYLHRSVTR